MRPDFDTASSFATHWIVPKQLTPSSVRPLDDPSASQIPSNGRSALCTSLRSARCRSANLHRYISDSHTGRYVWQCSGSTPSTPYVFWNSGASCVRTSISAISRSHPSAWPGGAIALQRNLPPGFRRQSRYWTPSICLSLPHYRSTKGSHFKRYARNVTPRPPNGQMASSAT